MAIRIEQIDIQSFNKVFASLADLAELNGVSQATILSTIGKLSSAQSAALGITIDMSSYATKADISNLATQADLTNLANNIASLQPNLATKSDINGLSQAIAAVSAGAATAQDFLTLSTTITTLTNQVNENVAALQAITEAVDAVINGTTGLNYSLPGNHWDDAVLDPTVVASYDNNWNGPLPSNSTDQTLVWN